MAVQVILEIRHSGIIAGIYSGYKPIYEYKSSSVLFPQKSGLLSDHDLQILATSIHVALRTSIEKLLVSATQVHVVVIEPPLFAMPLKKIVSQVILAEIRALSLTFLSWAACWCVAKGISNGLIDTNFGETRYVVPVYDHRELSHLIRSDNPDGIDAIEAVRELLPMELHDLEVIKTQDPAWIGAAIVCQNNTLKNQTSRSRYLKTSTIYDSLFT